MIRKVLLPILVMSVVASASGQAQRQAGQRLSNETTAIGGLNFCAFMLREFYDKDEKGRTIYVLMEPRQVSESNLYLLFRILSERFNADEDLTIWVDTDVEQLAFLATGTMVTFSPARGVIDDSARGHNKRILQLAYYKRTKAVELFRYNPNYPIAGEKTVIIRGKED